MPESEEPGQTDYAVISGGVWHNVTPSNREQLRATFDSAAERYHRYRPEYPDEVFDTLIELARLTAGARLLEVGCATGKATLPLARRGFAITGLELGADLAAQGRRNLKDFPQVQIVQAPFETWEPPDATKYDLIYAATAWHWIDPARRYPQSARLLRPGGHLAFWSASHVFPEDGDPFFAELQEAYDEIGEGMPPGTLPTRPGAIPDARAEIEESGLFSGVEVRQFDWETCHDADSYIGLLDTFSGHIAMEDWQRERLFGEVRRRLARRPGGMLRRHWGAALHVARRRDTEQVNAG